MGTEQSLGQRFRGAAPHYSSRSSGPSAVGPEDEEGRPIAQTQSGLPVYGGRATPRPAPTAAKRQLRRRGGTRRTPSHSGRITVFRNTRTRMRRISCRTARAATVHLTLSIRPLGGLQNHWSGRSRQLSRRGSATPVASLRRSSTPHRWSRPSRVQWGRYAHCSHLSRLQRTSFKLLLPLHSE